MFNSCIPGFDPKESDKLFYKKIQTPVATLEWYTFSSSYSDYPGYLVLKKVRMQIQYANATI
jgi:hypothetical protein